MEARKNPEYLKSLATAVTDFREALVDLVELYVENGEAGGFGGVARGIAPAVFPRKDADKAEIGGRQARVSRATGLAAAAVPLTDVGSGYRASASSIRSPDGRRSPGRSRSWKPLTCSAHATRRSAGSTV